MSCWRRPGSWPASCPSPGVGGEARRGRPGARRFRLDTQGWECLLPRPGPRRHDLFRPSAPPEPRPTGERVDRSTAAGQSARRRPHRPPLQPQLFDPRWPVESDLPRLAGQRPIRPGDRRSICAPLLPRTRTAGLRRSRRTGRTGRHRRRGPAPARYLRRGLHRTEFPGVLSRCGRPPRARPRRRADIRSPPRSSRVARHRPAGARAEGGARRAADHGLAPVVVRL